MCTEGVCEEEERMTKQEGFERAHSNSAQWVFKNKHRQPGAMRTKAGQCQVS